jgi:hypothetical protein
MTLAERGVYVQKGESHIRAKDSLFVLDCFLATLLAMTLAERGVYVQKGESHIRAKDSLFVLDCFTTFAMTLAERGVYVQKGESHIRAKDSLFVLDCFVLLLRRARLGLANSATVKRLVTVVLVALRQVTT